MKSYVTEKEMRLVGKAWEIRHHLRTLSKKAIDRDLKLADYLKGSVFRTGRAAGRTRPQPRRQRKKPDLL
jgi:hypothetical protein